MMQIKEQSEGNAQCRWISTAIMLADCLTKPMDASFLRKVLAIGRFRIFDETKTLKTNANRKFGERWAEGFRNLATDSFRKEKQNVCEFNGSSP